MIQKKFWIKKGGKKENRSLIDKRSLLWRKRATSIRSFPIKFCEKCKCHGTFGFPVINITDPWIKKKIWFQKTWIKFLIKNKFWLKKQKGTGLRQSSSVTEDRMSGGTKEAPSPPQFPLSSLIITDFNGYLSC